MINFWYKLLYHMNSGHSINWFNGDFDFTLDFINNIGIEIIGNFLMFYLLAFYILYLKKNKRIKMEEYSFKRNSLRFNY